MPALREGVRYFLYLAEKIWLIVLCKQITKTISFNVMSFPGSPEVLILIYSGRVQLLLLAAMSCGVLWSLSVEITQLLLQWSKYNLEVFCITGTSTFSGSATLI